MVSELETVSALEWMVLNMKTYYCSPLQTCFGHRRSGWTHVKDHLTKASSEACWLLLGYLHLRGQQRGAISDRLPHVPVACWSWHFLMPWFCFSWCFTACEWLGFCCCLFELSGTINVDRCVLVPRCSFFKSLNFWFPYHSFRRLFSCW